MYTHTVFDLIVRSYQTVTGNATMFTGKIKLRIILVRGICTLLAQISLFTLKRS